MATKRKKNAAAVPIGRSTAAKDARWLAKGRAKRAIVGLRAELRKIRAERHAIMAAAGAKCRASRDFAKGARERVREAKIRARSAREDAKGACAASPAAATLKSAIADARKALERELAKMREIRAAEKATRAEGPKGPVRASARERAEESDDEVRQNLGDPKLVAMFNRVKRSIKATPRKSRTEAFLEMVESDRGNMLADYYGAIEDETDAMIRAHERELRAGGGRRHANPIVGGRGRIDVPPPAPLDMYGWHLLGKIAAYDRDGEKLPRLDKYEKETAPQLRAAGFITARLKLTPFGRQTIERRALVGVDEIINEADPDLSYVPLGTLADLSRRGLVERVTPSYETPQTRRLVQWRLTPAGKAYAYGPSRVANPGKKCVGCGVQVPPGALYCSACQKENLRRFFEERPELREASRRHPSMSGRKAKNPEAPARTYERTHWGDGGARKRPRMMTVPDPKAGPLVELGVLRRVEYETRKGERATIDTFFHDFGRRTGADGEKGKAMRERCPVLAFNRDGLFIVGGRYDVKTEGIVG